MSSHYMPIVWIGGQAGTGKDTVGDYIAGVYRGVCLAQSDPMKRFVRTVFGFTEEQLWGPSANRNAADNRTVTERDRIRDRFIFNGDDELLELVVPEVHYSRAAKALTEWFETYIWPQLVAGRPISPRLVLQTLGTEWGRHISKDMWSEYALKTARALLGGGHSYSCSAGLVENAEVAGFDFVAITDGRFRNEALNVRTASGIAIKVERPDADKTVVETSGIQGHTSESELNSIPRHFFNDVIVNDGTIDDLADKVDGLLRYYYGV